MNMKQLIDSILIEAEELRDASEAGGNLQYAFELTADTEELVKALELLTDHGTRIRIEMQS